MSSVNDDEAIGNLRVKKKIKILPSHRARIFHKIHLHLSQVLKYSIIELWGDNTKGYWDNLRLDGEF